MDHDIPPYWPPGSAFFSLPPILAALDPVSRCIRIVGSKAALARERGITINAIPGWRRRRYVPAHHHFALEQLVGGAVNAREFLEWNEGHDDTYRRVVEHYQQFALAARRVNGHDAARAREETGEPAMAVQ